MIDVISAPTYLHPLQDIKLEYEVKQFKQYKNYL